MIVMHAKMLARVPGSRLAKCIDLYMHMLPFFLKTKNVHDSYCRD